MSEPLINDTAICPVCNGSGCNAGDADCGFCGGCGGVPMEAAERWDAEERRWNPSADRLIDHARSRATRPCPVAAEVDRMHRIAGEK